MELPIWAVLSLFTLLSAWSYYNGATHFSAEAARSTDLISPRQSCQFTQ